MRYYTIQNEQLIIAENENALKRYYVNVKPLPDDYEENKYIVQNGELVVNPDYEEEKKQKRREYLDGLKLSCCDVELALYKARGITFDDLKEIIKQQAPDIDIKEIGIELKRGTFDRDNKYVIQIATLLGYTSDDLDYLYENKELPPPPKKIEIAYSVDPVRGCSADPVAPKINISSLL